MMIGSKPNFVASMYAPNPNEVSYWIDLSSDSDGNVIKSYDADAKMWIPLNSKANINTIDSIKNDNDVINNKIDLLYAKINNINTILSLLKVNFAQVKQSINSIKMKKV